MTFDTKKTYPTTQGKILQLDYDFITSLSGQNCYCLTDAQVQMILGMIDYLGWQTRWYSFSATVELEEILKLQGGLVETLMNGCCGDNFKPSRITEDGHYQVSNDGGVTFDDAITGDPRYGAPVSPPNLPDGTVSADCTYADSIVEFFKQGVDQINESGGTLTNIVAILTGLATALFGVITGGIAAIIIPILTAIGVAIVAVGLAAFTAAWTEAVWDRLRCLIRDNIQDDGTFTQANVDAIYNGIAETGIALIFLRSWIAALQMTGLANAARSGRGAPDADCGDCDDFCGSSWIWADPPFPANGTIVYDGAAKTIVADAILNPGNGFYYFAFDSLGDCCEIEFTGLTGSINAFSRGWICPYSGTPTWGDEGNANWNADPTGNYSGWMARSTVPFSARIGFA